MRYRIKVMNAIAQEGLDLLDDRFEASPDERDPHGILVRSSPVDIEPYADLLAVARAGAGVNNIPVDECSRRGICVFNTPGANANAVVELVFTMLGNYLRHAVDAVAFCRSLEGLEDARMNEEVEARKKRFKGEEMAGKTLGVIGLGKIGVRIANAGIHHQMRVLGFDPFPLLENIHELSPEVELTRTRAEVLAKADYVSVHVPLNDNTRHLVNEEFLAKMRPGAVLLNYARGPVVDEEAVLAALDQGKLAGHITDFPSPAFIRHDKVLCSPHLGASTSESEGNCACMAVRELMEYLRYGNISHSVNFPNVESIPTVKVRSRLIVVNEDRPGMIGQVSHILGRHGLNIMSFVNESNNVVGYNIIDLAQPAGPEVAAEIEAQEGVIRTRIIDLWQ